MWHITGQTLLVTLFELRNSSFRVRKQSWTKIRIVYIIYYLVLMMVLFKWLKSQWLCQKGKLSTKLKFSCSQSYSFRISDVLEKCWQLIEKFNIQTFHCNRLESLLSISYILSIGPSGVHALCITELSGHYLHCYF